MSKSYEQISNFNANSTGKTDANTANDALHLGGIPAEQYATHKDVQDYHDKKEAELKEYIDSQDESNLEEAKEYANALVRNQDFSKFAMDTDIQALDEKLSDKISIGLQEQKNYTDTKTKQIVDDTNANFEDVNNSINILNNNMNEVFQSVSDGKTEVAEAITDKGVTTSATDTFGQMATNIKKITTGGSIPDGYIDTSDANATASDISLGKSAYANGQKIYGTNPGVNISQITPSYGTDTSGTTATVKDILVGKTAYSNGQLLIGTLDIGIEETYGLVNEEYSKKEVAGYSNVILPDTDNAISKSTGIFAISPCGNFIVNEAIVTQGGIEERYIQSRRMNDEEVYIGATASNEGGTIRRKSLFSFEELGLDPSIPVNSISIGNPGLNGVATDAALCIVQGKIVHFYRYSLASGSYGYIGYDYSTNYNWHWETTLDLNLTSPFTCSNLNPNVFAAFGKRRAVLIEIGSSYENILYIEQAECSDRSTPIDNCKFSLNDNYIYGVKLNGEGGYSGDYGFIAKVNPTTHYRFATDLIRIDGDLVVLPNEEQILRRDSIYSLIYDENLKTISVGNVIASKLFPGNHSAIYPVTKYSGFSPDMKYFYRAYPLNYNNQIENNIYIFKVSEDLISPWEITENIVIPAKSLGNFKMAYDMSFGTIGGTNELIRIRKSADNTNIVAVKYKGKQFYSIGYTGGV